jgi:hypothetical protein
MAKRMPIRIDLPIRRNVQEFQRVLIDEPADESAVPKRMCRAIVTRRSGGAYEDRCEAGTAGAIADLRRLK